MSEAASAFIPRHAFVKREQLRIDSAKLFASADLAAQPFSRYDSYDSGNLSAETIAWLHF
jgi:hypothetical protein